MNICDDNEENPTLIPGHVYQSDKTFYICIKGDYADEWGLWYLESGLCSVQFTSDRGIPNYMKDVTNQYCLKKIETC